MTLIKLYETFFYIVYQMILFWEPNVKQTKVGTDT